MAEAAPQTEQPSESMEEILQSIKRIIEDDTETDATPAAGNVLELTDMISEEGDIKKVAPAKAAPAAPEDKQSAIDEMFSSAPAAPVAAVPSQAVPSYPADNNGLMSDQAVAAAAVAFKPIVESTMKDYSIPHIPSPNLRSGNTVEDLLLEALRPMLKDWLDENLPVIVQKIVEKEVKRIVTLQQD